MKMWEIALLGSLSILTSACVAPKSEVTMTDMRATESAFEKRMEKPDFRSIKPITKTAKIKNVYSDQELISLLKKNGYNVVELLEKTVIKVVINNQNYALYNLTGQSGKLYLVRYFENDLNLGLDVINQWNIDNVFTAVKQDNLITMSIMLYTATGVTEEQILNLLSIGENAAVKLVSFIMKQENKK